MAPKRWLVALCPDDTAPDPHVLTFSAPADQLTSESYSPLPCWVPGSTCTEPHALLLTDVAPLRSLLGSVLDARDTGPLIHHGAPGHHSEAHSGAPGRVPGTETGEGTDTDGAAGRVSTSVPMSTPGGVHGG